MSTRYNVYVSDDGYSPDDGGGFSLGQTFETQEHMLRYVARMLDSGKAVQIEPEAATG